MQVFTKYRCISLYGIQGGGDRQAATGDMTQAVDFNLLQQRQQGFDIDAGRGKQGITQGVIRQ